MRTTSTKWERRTATPLLIAALVFVGVLSYPVIEPQPTQIEERVVSWLNVGIWLLFAVDYGVRLTLATDRRAFIRQHIPDLLVVLLPALRPLRLLRLLSVARLIAQRSRRLLLGNLLRLVTGAGALLVYIAAVGVLNFERPAKNANITTFGDALWWACTTITTVGYGDRFPVTWQGRGIAVVLMIVGIALLGILTAGIAAWFVQASSREEEIAQDLEADDRLLLEIRDRLDSIDRALKREVRS